MAPVASVNAITQDGKSSRLTMLITSPGMCGTLSLTIR
jgi:hypothetical protein